MSERVIVIGAGIAGLTAAFRLKQHGFEVRVLEREGHVGGRMSTRTARGFRIDLGASILPSTYRRMSHLIADAGLQAQVVPTSDLVGVYRDGQVHRFRAASKLDLLKTQLLSWSSKVALSRMLLDLQHIGAALDWYDISKAAPWDIESAAQYARRRLNDELLEYLLAPALGSFHLSSPERLSIVDFFFALRNVLGGTFFNSRTGADFLCRGLAAQLPVELTAHVSGVAEHAGGVRVAWSRPGMPERIEDASACVVAVPATQVRALYPQLDAVRSDVLGRIEYSTSVAVHLGLARAPDERAILIQVPRREHPELRAVIFDHNKAPGRAPPGKGLLATYWQHDFGLRNYERDDAAVIETAIAGIDRVLPGLGGDIELAHVQRWRSAAVLSRPGAYRELTRLVQATDPRARVQLAGDYFSISTSHASLCSGERAAQRLIAAFGSASSVGASSR
ncbi:MAG: NAD(P)/FAD-dependent oxidoreductase [Polyangia bacterium]